MNPVWGLAFSWVSPLLQRGAKRTQLQFADLFQLPGELHPKRCFDNMWGAWTKVSSAFKAQSRWLIFLIIT